jgi:hypothetical protein
MNGAVSSAMFEVHLVRGHEVDELDEAALDRMIDGGGELARAVIDMDPLEGALVVDDGRARASIIDELASAIQRLCFEAVATLIESPAARYSYRYFNADAMVEIVASGA